MRVSSRVSSTLMLSNSLSGLTIWRQASLLVSRVLFPQWSSWAASLVLYCVCPPEISYTPTEYLLTFNNSAFVVCDRIGRVWATRQLCVFWILGIAIFIGNNGNLILAKRHPDVETIEINEETASDSDDDELTLEGGSAMAPWPQCPCGRKRRRRSDCASRSQTYRSLEHGKQSRHRNTVGHQTKPDDAVTVIMEH